MPKLLVTRPETDAGSLLQALDRMAIAGVVCPMLQVRYLADAPLDVQDVQALLLTSANGARAIAARDVAKTLPVFAVGDATAREARALGFDRVASANGNVEDLAALVRQQCNPKEGPVVHAAGTAVAGDLAGDLERSGFDVRRAQLYVAETAMAVPPLCQTGLHYHWFDGVIVYSPRTVKSFEAALKSHGLESKVRGLTLFSLSAAVDKAATLAWENRVVSALPTQESLLERLRTWYY